MKRRALLILGMHRAGTSALARVAALRGARLPEHVMPANAGNASGYWEPEAVVRLNDHILDHYATSWDDPFAARVLPRHQDFPATFAREASALIRDEYGSADLILIKDPRCTLLQPFWDSVLCEAGIAPATVIIARPWAEVVDSLMRRDRTSAVGAALLYVAYGLEAARRLDASTTCVTYAALMSDWRAVTERIAMEQDFSWPNSAEQASAEVEAYLKPAARLTTEPRLPPQLLTWADTVGEWFSAAIPSNAFDLRSVGNIEDRLDALQQLAGPLLHDRKRARDAVARELSQTRAKVEMTAAERDDALAERDVAFEERDSVVRLYKDTDALLQQANADYAHLDATYADLQQVHVDQGRELATVYASRSWRLTNPLRWMMATWHRVRRLGLDDSNTPEASKSGLIRRDSGKNTARGAGYRLQLQAYLAAEFGRRTAVTVLARIERYQLPWQTTAARAPAAIECSLESALIWTKEIALRANSRKIEDIPDVSIIVPVYNQLPFTLACIDSLISHVSRFSFEILIGDDASHDQTAAALVLPIKGLVYVRNDENLGFVRNCNLAAKQARGRYVLFLNNDTQVLPGWLDELIGTLESDPEIGLAGSKLIYPDGSLQECGAIVWRDGTAWNYGRLANPGRPEYCYMRDVDYVSGASIALRRELWQELHGFDELFLPAYAEDADLAFRIRDKGLRTVVQPLSQVVHFEGVSSGTDPSSGAKAHQAENLNKLRQRWAEVLQSHRENGDAPELEKERTRLRRILFIDHCTPNTSEDAGSVVAFEIMKIFIADGYKVTFVPEDNFAHMGATTRDLQRIGIETIYHPAYSRMSELLAQRDGGFDVVFLHRFGVAEKHMKSIRRKYPAAKVIFLNADIHFLRERREAELNGDSEAESKSEDTRRRELDVVANADVTLVHSDFELQLLKSELPNACIVLFPLIHEPIDVVPSLGGRSGVCFVGGFRHPPNADGIGWFVRDCWPLVLMWNRSAELYIVGSHVTPEVEALADHPGVNVVGFVEDLERFLGQRRITVAPLRYGAGAKGKIAASMAHGVPVVCTPLAAEGMRLADDKNVLIADDAQILAEHIVKLMEDDSAWYQFSRAGLDYARDYSSRARATERMRGILEF